MLSSAYGSRPFTTAPKRCALVLMPARACLPVCAETTRAASLTHHRATRVRGVVHPQRFLSVGRQPSRHLGPQYLQRYVPTSTGALGEAAVMRDETHPLEVPPATLPGTPATFNIPPQKLIELAKQLFARDVGLQDPSDLADDFRFEFPVVSLSKEDYLKAVRSFNLKTAFPNMAPHPYDWRVDPYEPHRVWFTIRNTATHTGGLTFFGRTIKPTGKVVLGAPECESLVFNADGKCTSYTGGYIMDRRVGNTNKLGAMFGILSAIGQPVPQPGSLRAMAMQAVMKANGLVSGLFHFFTLGLFRRRKSS